MQIIRDDAVHRLFNLYSLYRYVTPSSMTMSTYKPPFLIRRPEELSYEERNKLNTYKIEKFLRNGSSLLGRYSAHIYIYVPQQNAAVLLMNEDAQIE